ncbi:hypothetical protein WJX74_005366 [Apatococcus lobatus]|uniref:Uncharacterized protein n=1 Tax=Apatococcus lobatus TaxID=904363 RepID=A0AAW1RM41_9CHLO
MENSFRLPSPPTSLYDTIQIVPSNFLPLAQRNGALHSAKSLATQRNPQTLCVPSTPRSALELTLAASLTLGNTPNSPTHRPASLERAAKGSGKQPAVAKLTLEAGASPRSIAVSDALIDGFQSDPASHETFRPVHYTAKAAQRAAKLAHLKAARQAQRLVRPSTSPVRSCSPLNSSQQRQSKKIACSSAEVLTTAETESGKCQTPKAANLTTRSSPASPLSRVPFQPESMSTVQDPDQPLLAMSARVQRDQQQNGILVDAAGRAASSAAGSGALSARFPQRQRLSQQCLDLPALGAFMPRQRSGLGPGPHPVHDAFIQENIGPVATQPLAPAGKALNHRPASRANASDPDPAACESFTAAVQQQFKTAAVSEGTKFPNASKARSAQAQQRKVQLQVCGSSVGPANASPFVSLPVGEEACSLSNDDASQQLGLGPAIVIGSATDGYVSPTRKAPGDVTLKRGLESLERCWQSHAGPSNLIPSLQARRSGSGCLDLPVEPAATNNTACTSPQLYSQGDPPKCCQTAAGDPDRCPEQEHSDGQSSSQAASAVAASPSRLFMGNATLDKNLQSLQRRWDSQKSRQLQKGQRSPHRKKSIDQKQS